jgi:hypothetical protein
MGDYRHRASGLVQSQRDWRRHYANVSLPRVWNQNTLDGLALDPVLAVPPPAVGPYQIALRDGVEQDAKGNWVERWTVGDRFADYVDADGVLHTTAEQEAAYQARLDATAAASVRAERDRRLAETDWVVIRHTEHGTNIPLAWELYRQALRDVSVQPGFPHEVEWPVSPHQSETLANP